MDTEPSYPGGSVIVVSPSDNAWRSKNYNMLIKEQRFLSEMANLASEGAAEGAEWDTSRILSPSTFRIATTAGLLDNSTLEKLGFGHLIQSSSSMEGLHSAYTSTLLIDTKSISSKQESFSNYGQDSSFFNNESVLECGGFAIRPENLVKALRLLYDPPFSTTFESEEEMIQVYQLIYDALRYRVVFDQALKTISFYAQYPKLQKHQRIVHMFFFDLHQRQFLSRDNFSSSKDDSTKDVSEILFGPEEEECLDFKEIVKEAENTLWNLRVHLAASVARLRIKRHAFCLLSMLPEQLRNPSHLDGSAKRPLSFWINNFLIRKDTITHIFKDSGLKMLDKDFLHPQSSSILELEDGSYFYDRLCTNLIFCNPCLRNIITHSQLVKQSYLVIQDRSFCLGPSTLCQKLNKMDISGAIVQTHINSVRVTAYLASLLNENKPPLAIKPDVVLAFGAGNRKTEYETSFQAMGITNVIVYSETWVQVAYTVVQCLVDASILYAEMYPNIAISPDFTDSCISIPSNMENIFQQLDNVVAVYATPPNSYSGVPDPVGLAVSRGGDIKLLEDITRSMSIQYEIIHEDILNSESDEDLNCLIKMAEKERKKEDEEQREKMDKLMKEQWEVLSLCLSLPQIQMVLYETYSNKDSENKGMVENVVKEANNAARANFNIYQEEQSTVLKGAEENGDQPIIKDLLNEPEHLDSLEVEKKQFHFVKEIPLTDLFEVDDLPQIKGTTIEDGCFISLIKRKELICRNNRYLIQMAEARGLFGKKTDGKVLSPSESAKGGKGKRKGRLSSFDSNNSEEYSMRPRSKSKQLEIERISAPTIASLRRSCRWASWQNKDKGRGESDTNTDEKNYLYTCRRCVSHGDDACQFTVKECSFYREKSIPIGKPHNDWNGKKKKKEISPNITSQEKLLKRLTAPTEVSLLRQNISWKEYKSKFQHERRNKFLQGKDSLNLGSVNNMILTAPLINRPGKHIWDELFGFYSGKEIKCSKRTFSSLYMEDISTNVMDVGHRGCEEKYIWQTTHTQDLTKDSIPHKVYICVNNNEQEKEPIFHTENFTSNFHKRKKRFSKTWDKFHVGKGNIAFSHSEFVTSGAKIRSNYFYKNEVLCHYADVKEQMLTCDSEVSTSISTVKEVGFSKNGPLIYNIGEEEKVLKPNNLFDEIIRRAHTENTGRIKQETGQGCQISVDSSKEYQKILDEKHTFDVYKYKNKMTQNIFSKKYAQPKKQKVDEIKTSRKLYPLRTTTIKFRYPDRS